MRGWAQPYTFRFVPGPLLFVFGVGVGGCEGYGELVDVNEEEVLCEGEGRSGWGARKLGAPWTFISRSNALPNSPPKK